MSSIPFPTYYDACPKTPDSEWEKVLETDQVLFDVTSVGKDRILPSKKIFNGDYSKDDFVEMPFSDRSYWQMIKTKICDAQFENISQLETAITSYNKSIRSLKCLDAFFKTFPDEQSFFFESLLPKMQKIVRNALNILAEAPCLLKTGMNKSIWMTQEQCATALVLSFFCCWPESRIRMYKSQNATYNHINFDHIFQYSSNYYGQIFPRLQCFLHYFKRVTDEMPVGVISFKRICASSFPDLKNPNIKWQEVCFVPDGLIEGKGTG